MQTQRGLDLSTTKNHAKLSAPPSAAAGLASTITTVAGTRVSHLD